MRKTLGLVAFVVLVSFAATGCATGGYLGANPYPGPLGQVVAGNLALTCPGDYFIGPPINSCLRSLARIGPQFAGYPMNVGGRGGRSLSRTEKIAVIGGAGAVVGGLISRDWKGAVIGGAVGAVATAVATRRGGNNQTVVTPPSPGQGVRIASDGTPVATGTRPRSGAVQSSLGIGNQPSGLIRRAVNRTGMEVAVFPAGADPSREESLKVLARGESFEVPLNDGGYDVYILVPTNRLGVQDVRRATVVPNHDLNGWDIVVAP